jgi:hypothetical protein
MIKDDKIGKVYSMNGEKMVFMGTPERKRPVGWPR